MTKHPKGVDKHYEHTVEAADEISAATIFKTSAAKLLDVNTWHNTAGKGTAVFQRMDANGFALTGNAEKGDYWRIDIPGPGHSKGFDWVRVEYLSEEKDKVEIRVRPCADPTVKNNDTAHFLNDSATSTFVIEKTGLAVSAIILGRNESPNTAGNTLLKKARDLLVGIGAIAGTADMQWNKLAKGLLESGNQAASR